MPFKLLDETAEISFPLRWRRGPIFDTGYREAALQIAVEVDREEAAEIIADEGAEPPPAPRPSRSKKQIEGDDVPLPALPPSA